MKAMWTGAITFGMVAAPVKMYLGHDKHGDGLRLGCREHAQPIVAPRTCPVDGQKLAGPDIVKLAEVGGGFVTLAEHELDALPLANLHLIAIDRFVPIEDVPLATHAKGLYYLAPDKGGEKAYGLLRHALLGSDTVAIARVGMREREQLVALSVQEDALILTQLAWPADVRGTAGLALPHDLFGERELNLALMIVDNMRGTWSPQDFLDQHRAALQDLIALKAQGRVPPTAKKPQRGADDLLQALQASVAKQAQKKPAKKKRVARVA